MTQEIVAGRDVNELGGAVFQLPFSTFIQRRVLYEVAASSKKIFSGIFFRHEYEMRDDRIGRQAATQIK